MNFRPTAADAKQSVALVRKIQPDVGVLVPLRELSPIFLKKLSAILGNPTNISKIFLQHFPHRSVEHEANY